MTGFTARDSAISYAIYTERALLRELREWDSDAPDEIRTGRRHIKYPVTDLDDAVQRAKQLYEAGAEDLLYFHGLEADEEPDIVTTREHEIEQALSKAGFQATGGWKSDKASCIAFVRQ